MTLAYAGVSICSSELYAVARINIVDQGTTIFISRHLCLKTGFFSKESQKRFITSLLVGCFMSGSAICASPKISSDSKLSTAGYFQLSWQDDSAHSFQLQQATRADFREAVTLYQGSDQATVISGLPDGDYFYRVANENHQLSKPIKVSVKHHSLSKALAFFGLGAVMFVIMVSLLIRGATRKETS